MVDVIQYAYVNSSKSLAFYVAYSFIHDQLTVGGEMGILLGLTETTMVNMHIKLYNWKKPKALDRNIFKEAKCLAEMVATSLGLSVGSASPKRAKSLL